jgi:hypothetical protein
LRVNLVNFGASPARDGRSSGFSGGVTGLPRSHRPLET